MGAWGVGCFWPLRAFSEKETTSSTWIWQVCRRVFLRPGGTGSIYTFYGPEEPLFKSLTENFLKKDRAWRSIIQTHGTVVLEKLLRLSAGALHKHVSFQSGLEDSFALPLGGACW